MNEEQRERRSYLIGAGLSVVLTMLAFGSVTTGLERTAALWVIGLAAVMQIVTQLHFFLHIGLGRQKREDLQLILFSLLLLAIMVGGTLWILHNLAQRMLYEGVATDSLTPVGVVGRFAGGDRYLIITVYQITEI